MINILYFTRKRVPESESENESPAEDDIDEDVPDPLSSLNPRPPSNPKPKVTSNPKEGHTNVSFMKIETNIIFSHYCFYINFKII